MRRVGSYSMGMAQRLGLAGALLGDPQTIVLDEPINGLDPDGIVWVRHFLRALAAEGRTVFLSSHLMSEMAQTADHLIVIGRGRLIADAPMHQVLAGVGATRVSVKTPEADRLAAALAGPDVTITSEVAGELEITGLKKPRRSPPSPATATCSCTSSPLAPPPSRRPTSRSPTPRWSSRAVSAAIR